MRFPWIIGRQTATELQVAHVDKPASGSMPRASGGPPVPLAALVHEVRVVVVPGWRTLAVCSCGWVDRPRGYRRSSEWAGRVHLREAPR